MYYFQNPLKFVPANNHSPKVMSLWGTQHRKRSYTSSSCNKSVRSLCLSHYCANTCICHVALEPRGGSIGSKGQQESPSNEHSCTLIPNLDSLDLSWLQALPSPRRVTEVISSFSMSSLLIQQLALLSKVAKVSQMIAQKIVHKGYRASIRYDEKHNRDSKITGVQQ